MFTHLKILFQHSLERIHELGSEEILIPGWVYYAWIGYFLIKILHRPLTTILRALLSLVVYLVQWIARFMAGLGSWLFEHFMDRADYTRKYQHKFLILIVLVVGVLIFLDRFARDRRPPFAQEGKSHTETLSLH